MSSYSCSNNLHSIFLFLLRALRQLQESNSSSVNQEHLRSRLNMWFGKLGLKSYVRHHKTKRMPLVSTFAIERKAVLGEEVRFVFFVNVGSFVYFLRGFIENSMKRKRNKR